MKKSDKLLLLLVLVALTLFSSAHLSVYLKYKKGESFSTNRTLFTRHNLPSPKYLVIQGFSNVTLIPSNDFSLEYEDREKISRYFSGDTLVASGWDTVSTTAPGQISEIGMTPILRVYYRDIPLIRQYNGSMNIEGDTVANHARSTRLLLNNVQMSLGPAGPEANEKPYYDQLSIESIGSNLTLLGDARISQLQLRLDSTSGG
ncbi:MAG: hypothetical protein ABUM51_10375, partial [Bacteroidota bacterium]